MLFLLLVWFFFFYFNLFELGALLKDILSYYILKDLLFYNQRATTEKAWSPLNHIQVCRIVQNSWLEDLRAPEEEWVHSQSSI